MNESTHAMLALPKLIEPLFLNAGWQPSKGFPHTHSNSLTGLQTAALIISEFAGLKVGESGPGTETGTSEVEFFGELLPRTDVAAIDWQRQVGRLHAFASAHNGYMLLMAGDCGKFYVATDIEDGLYRAGDEFGELMRCILWGYELGPKLTRDSELA